MSHIIPLHHGSNTAIAIDDALQRYPSLNASTAHGSRSERYQVISTADMLRRLDAEGFRLYQVSEATVRDETKRGYQKHLFRMRHHSTEGTGTGVPDIIGINSFDGSSAWQLWAGWFEFACSNGLIVGDIISRQRIAHVGNATPDKVITAAYSVISEAEAIKAEVADMRATTLPYHAIEGFETFAHRLRYGAGERAPVSPAAFGHVRRAVDNNNSLWSVYNRIQENVTRGGMRGRIVGANGRHRNSSVRAIRSIDGTVAVNTALHGEARRLLNEYRIAA